MSTPRKGRVLSWLDNERVASGGIWALYIVLALISLVLVISAMVSEVYKYDKESVFTAAPIVKHIIMLILGALVILIVPKVFLRLKKDIQITFILIYVFIAYIMVLLVPFFGVSINNARRWFVFLGLSIQPSDFMKLAAIFIAAFFAYKINRLRAKISTSSLNSKQEIEDRINKYFKSFWFISASFIFFIMLSNFSTAGIFALFVTIFSIIIQAPIKKISKLIMYACLLLALGYGFVKVANIKITRLSTWENRIENMFSTEENPYSINDSNRQEKFSRIALANGNLFGRGINNSKMKNMLPQAYSDFIMSVAYEEYGIFSVIMISFIFIFWIAISRAIAGRSENIFCRYVAYGIGLIYPIQVIVNFAVASGLIMTGQPLPIIGRGGSSILSTSLCLATLIIISRLNENQNKSTLNDTQSNY